MMAANLNPNLEASQTQAERILSALLAGESLTSLDALERFGCARLASRISDLKQRGYPISSKLVETASGKRVAQYRLAPGGAAVPPPSPGEPDPLDREAEGRQADLFASETAYDGPSWLSRDRWER